MARTVPITPYRLPGTRAYTGSWKFPNPFFDIASEYVPINITQTLEWAEFLFLIMGTYRSAARKVVRYFLTEIILEGESDKERTDFEKFLKEDLHLLTELAQIGDDFMVYGNVFISLYFPFERFLICPSCGMHYYSKFLPYQFKAARLEFHSECPKCNYKGAFNHEDRRSPDRAGVRLIRWNPKQIRLRVHPVSGQIEYYWEIPALFLDQLRSGEKFFVDSTPWRILQCLRKGRGTEAGPVLFKFSDDSIYHMKETSLAGIPIYGWGLPPVLSNFKLAYYIQILRRYDEAIALDFIVPHRIIFPDSGPAGNDPLRTHSLDQFVSRMQELVQRHRYDPTTVQVAPYKVGYQMLGGEGKTLAPKEQIAMAMDELLNSLGYPAELYKGSLNLQAAPVALRLFEKTWGSLVDGNNTLINWILKRCSTHFMWGDMTGSLRSVTLADDLERKALSLQAAAGMDISKSTAYKPFALDYMAEQRRIIEEQQEIQRLQQEAQEEAQAQQGMEGGSSGGGGQGAGVGATPGDVYEQAKALAQQLLFQTPETMRRGELIKIKQSNPTLHALVLQEMKNVRQEMGRQGGAQMMEQAKQQGAGAPGGGGMVATAAAKDLPSAIGIDLLLVGQTDLYSRDDMKKIAMSIQAGHSGAKDAFHYIFCSQRGWPCN